MQVLSNRYYFPRGFQIGRNEGPINRFRTTGVLHADSLGGVGDPCVYNLASGIPYCYEKKSIPFHVQNVEGFTDSLGNSIEVKLVELGPD